MESMHVFNYKGTLSEAEWRIARLYLKLVFVKDRPGEIHFPSSPDMPPPGSPDGPPPGYHQPSSPDGPPSGFARFGPSSPDGPPPGMFAPSSPDSPPPGHNPFMLPSSPDSPPPGYSRFAPSSPDGPPPGYLPSSPDGPPPGFNPFRPSSPDGPPPGFRPSSPDSPPPDFNPFMQRPSSPDGPPPGYAGKFAPSSPDGPPPGMFAPSSPDGPPPGHNPFFAPASPDSPPPGYKPLTGNKRTKSAYESDSEDEQEASKRSRTAEINPFAANPFAQAPSAPVPLTAATMYGSDDDEPRAGNVNNVNNNISAPDDYDPYADDSDDDEKELDPATKLLMEIRELAMEMAGGEDEWDTLNDDQIDEFLAAARTELQWGGEADTTDKQASGGISAMPSTPDSSPPNPFAKGPSTPDAPAPGLAFAASPDSTPPDMRFPLQGRSVYESDDDTPAPPRGQGLKQGGGQGPETPVNSNATPINNPYGSDSEPDNSPSNPFAAKSSSSKPAVPDAPAPFYNPYGDDD